MCNLVSRRIVGCEREARGTGPGDGAAKRAVRERRDFRIRETREQRCTHRLCDAIIQRASQKVEVVGREGGNHRGDVRALANEELPIDALWQYSARVRSPKSRSRLNEDDAEPLGKGRRTTSSGSSVRTRTTPPKSAGATLSA